MKLYKLLISSVILAHSLFSDGRIIGDYLINPKDYLGNELSNEQSLRAYTTSRFTNEFSDILNNGGLSGLGEFIANSDRMRQTPLSLNNDGQIVVSSTGSFSADVYYPGQQIYVFIQDITEATGLSWEIEYYNSSKWYVYTHPTFIDPSEGGTTYITGIYDLMPIGISDSDEDGVADPNDVFPYNPNESSDSDNDGIGDNSDKHPGFNDGNLDTYLNINQYLKISDIKDLRPGSTMIEVTNNEASIQLKMEESTDLNSWTEINGAATMTVPVPSGSDTKFFRFKMD